MHWPLAVEQVRDSLDRFAESSQRPRGVRDGLHVPVHEDLKSVTQRCERGRDDEGGQHDRGLRLLASNGDEKPLEETDRCDVQTAQYRREARVDERAADDEVDLE